MSRNNLYILHFRPIEYYPPVQNFIKTVLDSENSLTWSCITTNGLMKSISFVGFKTFRFGSFDSGKLSLWWTYLRYNFSAIIKLIVLRPNQLIYYESLSSFPAYLYKKFINKKAKLYIHYHEYTSPEEYKKSSPIEQFFHKLEKSIFPLADWISHTNNVRLNKFLLDEQLVFNKKVHQVLPNYPSKKWAILNNKRKQDEPLKLVYVGYSLTEEGSYLLELADFLVHSEIPIQLNIFCLKKNEFIYNLGGIKKNLTIEIFDELAYSEIPLVLSKHHVGLILYKAKTPNYIFNAPNKLFEYLSCGLDVWYPCEMQGIYEYDSNETPLVKRLEFNNLSDKKIMNLFSCSEKSEESEKSEKFKYSAEEVYLNLINKILSE